jgi:hypothetical protein
MVGDWLELMEAAGLEDGSFGEEEAAFCFIMSMPIVVDEMQTDRHKNMSIGDFIEALGKLFKTKYSFSH